MQSVYSALADWANLNVNDSKSLQLSRTRLSIIADHNSSRIISILPLISISLRFLSIPLGTILMNPAAIGIIVTFMSYRFFSSQAKIQVFV